MSANTVSYASPVKTRRPSASWYWIAGLLLVAGFVAAGVWAVGAVVGLVDHVDQFPGTNVPGEISVVFDRADIYYVYYEGAGDTTLDRLGVSVTDPAGETLAVRPVDGGVLYDTADRAVGHAVGEFQASTTGTYAVTVTGDSGGETVAVGDGLTDDVLPPLFGAGLVLVVTTGAAIAIAVVTGVRRSRQTTSA